MALSPLCLRIPEDLHAAVRQLADQNGVSASEWVRDLIFRVVYGQPLGIEEGYAQGRALGYRTVMLMLNKTEFPATAEEATALLQAHGSYGRSPNG